MIFYNNCLKRINQIANLWTHTRNEFYWNVT